jgi:hypothetical protein
MFSDEQVKKIKYFASVTKITNECFKKCISFDDYINTNIKENGISEKNNLKSLNSEINKTEENCLKSCAENYVKLREFIETQLFADYDSIKNKNKRILEDET